MQTLTHSNNGDHYAMTPSSSVPLRIPRDEHPISRKHISKNALNVIYGLEQAGFEAYLVGGGVRDLLLGQHPKDFDVATNAHPEQIVHLFKRSRIVGRRFQIVHVRFGREVIEVTTFRADHDEQITGKQAQSNEKGMLIRDNVYGSLKNDAMRRDFSVNALYYSINGFEVIDYTGGYADLKARQLKIIGNPERRYTEDPVRMLRAARFAAKLDFELDKATADIIPSMASQLAMVSSARLFDETLKLFMHGSALPTFDALDKLGLIEPLFPQTAQIITGDALHKRFIRCALSNTDERIAAHKPVTPAFLFAALLWPAVADLYALHLSNKVPAYKAMQLAGQAVSEQQQTSTAIPRRFSIPMREIWELQHKLLQPPRPGVERLLDKPRFRAAYDFVLLRQQAGEDVGNAAEWWTLFQTDDATIRQDMLDEVKKNQPKRKRKKKPKAARSRSG